MENAYLVENCRFCGKKKKEKKKEKAHALPLSQDIKLWGEG